MTAPTFKYATDTNPGTSAIYGAPDIVYAFHVIDGSHATDRIPIAAIEGTAVALSGTQTITGAKQFNNISLEFNSPTTNKQYIVNSSDITANRNITLPLLVSDDTFVFANFTQTLTNKTLSGSQNTFSSISASSITNTAAVLSAANTFVALQTISPTTTNGITLNFPTTPTGSASVFYGGIKTSQSTIAFATTAQTNDYYTNYLDSAILTNPSSGTIPNAATLKIVGAPIASTNVTITNNYALWVAAGTSKFDGAVTMTADSSIATTKKFGFNVGLTNYIYESATNVMSFATSSTESFRIGSTGGIGIISGQKFNVDGVSLAGDTYILESSANVFDLFVGGTNTLRSTASLVTAKVDMTVSGILTASDYIITTKNASGALPPVADDTGGFSATWNFSGGSGEVDFFNLFSINTVTDSYRWYQMLTNGTIASLLMTLGPNGYLTTYGKIATEGTGIAAIYKSTKQKSETGADTNVLTYTPPAVAGRYRVSVSISVSAATAATLGWTIAWTDSNGHAQTPANLPLFTQNSTTVGLTISVAANVTYSGSWELDIDNSAANIVVKTTFSGTSVAYKISAIVEQLA